MFKKNRFGRPFGIGSQPTPPIYLSEFGSLGQRLQQVLQQRVAQPNRLQIRCAVREGVLLVLVEHLLHVEPDSQQTFLVLEQVVRECLPELMASDSECKVNTATQPLPIRLYLRVAGYQQPYAFHSFTFETTPSPLPAQFERIANAGIAFPEPSISIPLRPDTSLVSPAAEPERIPQAEPIVERTEPTETLPTPEKTFVVEPNTTVFQPEPDVLAQPQVIHTPNALTEANILAQPNILQISPPEVAIEENALPSGVEPSPPFQPEPASFETRVSEVTVEEYITDDSENTQDKRNTEESIAESVEILVNPEAWTESETDLIHELTNAEDISEAVIEENVSNEIIVEALISDHPTPEVLPSKALIAEESIAEEPVIEAENSEEPIAEEPTSETVYSETVIVEEPIAEEPVIEAENSEEPIAEELVEVAIPATPIAEEVVIETEVLEEPVEIAIPATPIAEEPVAAENSEALISEESIAEEPVIEAENLEEPIAEEPVIEALVSEEPVSAENSEESIAEEPEEPFTEHYGLREIHVSETLEFEPIVSAASIEPEEVETNLEEHEFATDIDSIVGSEFEPVEPIAAIDLPMTTVVIEESIQVSETLPSEVDAVAEVIELQPTTLESPSREIPEIASPEVSTVEHILDESLFESNALETEFEVAESVEVIVNDSDATEPENSTELVENIELPSPAQNFFTEIEREQETNGHRNDLEIVEEPISTFMAQSTDRWIDQSANLASESLINESLNGRLSSDQSLSDETPVNQIPTPEVSTPEPPAKKRKVIQVSPLIVRPEHDLTASLESSSLLDQLPLDIKTKRRSSPSLATIMLSGAVGLFFVVSGAYVVTRPCVLGEVCPPLEQAQQLSQRALTTIQSSPGALEVVDAYDQLTQAIEHLETIPSWSRHYQTAQTLIAEYTSKVDVLGTVVQALNQANTATRKSLNPPHPVQIWREIQFIWRDAIATLEKIPADSPVYALAQSKLQEYRSNLDSINHRIVTEQDAQQRLDQVRQAANVTEARSQIVNSTDSWQQTITSWTTLLDQLKQIPQGTSAYTEAQRLMTLYGLKLENAEKQLSQSQLSTSAYTEASNLAEQARRAEQQSNWSQAASLWRTAITALKKIPEGTTYYSQAQTLLQPYTTSLNQAESNLKRITLTQTVQPQLDRLCSGIPRTCTFTIATEAMRVQLTPGYDQLVKQVLLSSQLQGQSPVRADVAGQVNQFLQSLGTVSQSAQVPLELYDSTGSRFAKYDPVRGGYTTQ